MLYLLLLKCGNYNNKFQEFAAYVLIANRVNPESVSALSPSLLIKSSRLAKAYLHSSGLLHRKIIF